MKEEEILEWVIDLHESTADVIESVDRKTLQVLINDVEHLAVFFCKSPSMHSQKAFSYDTLIHAQTTMNASPARISWMSWRTLTTTPISTAFSL